jgi:hypothetical protein
MDSMMADLIAEEASDSGEGAFGSRRGSSAGILGVSGREAADNLGSVGGGGGGGGSLAVEVRRSKMGTMSVSRLGQQKRLIPRELKRTSPHLYVAHRYVTASMPPAWLGRSQVYGAALPPDLVTFPFCQGDVKPLVCPKGCPGLTCSIG